MMDHTCWGLIGLFYRVNISIHSVSIGCVPIFVGYYARFWEYKNDLDPIHVKFSLFLKVEGNT